MLITRNGGCSSTNRSLKVLTLLVCGATLLFLAALVNAHERKVLRVAGWDVYADPENKSKTIGYRSFEEKYNVSIEFEPLANLDDIVDIAESRDDYDVFIISNEGIRILHDMELVAPLELNRLTHYSSLHHRLRYTEWASFDSKVYAVPWAWGPTGLLYDTDVMPEPDSWNVLWDEAYRGRVALWDDVSMIWTAALALGYRNVYSLTRAQLAEVRTKLLELNGNVHGYYQGEADELRFMTEGKVVALNSWFDPSARLRSNGRNYKMVIPREGAVGMFDSYLISASTHHTEIAHQYINHQISPPIQQKLVRITGLEPANIETLALLTPDEIKALHLDESEYFNRMLLWDNMPRKHLYKEVLEDVRAHLEQLRMQ